MPATASPPLAPAAPSLVAALLPIMAAVFIGYLVVGLAMPVLPLHVHQGLGLGTFVVGLVAGSQFAPSLISRLWAGHHADRSGANRAVVTGLLAAMGAYIACLDLALGIANPALGAIASGAGIGAVFLASTLTVLCAASIAIWLLHAAATRSFAQRGSD
jgi:MFS family permease